MRSDKKLLTLVSICLIAAAASFIRAERLPLKTYTTADGLASNRISRIVRDSRGFLWFCTEQGLSRFDGFSFVNYTTAQGLPDDDVTDFLETRAGEYWVATFKGLCQFNPTGAPKGRNNDANQMFVVYHPGAGPRSWSIKALFEDRSGKVWCGTWQGVYRIEREAAGYRFDYVDIGMPATRLEEQIVRNILEDRAGVLWFATDCGLYKRSPDGTASRFSIDQGLSSDRLIGLLEDREGRLWVGDRQGGLCEIVAHPESGRSIVARKLSLKEGLQCARIVSLFQSSDGRFWIGTECGLSQLLNTDESVRNIRTYMGVEVLTDPRVWALAEDGYGNLWIGTANGAVRVAQGGFTTYTEADGLSGREVINITESGTGELSVQTRSANGNHISRFDGQRFASVDPMLPHAGDSYNIILGPQDREGEWWLATPSGAWRFPKISRIEDLAHHQPKEFYTSNKDEALSTVHEDSRGDIWITRGSAIIRWERRTANFRQFSETEGLPRSGHLPSGFCEDRSGNIWFGFENGFCVRYANGRFRQFGQQDGIPEGVLRCFVDSKGRLWIASSNSGLARIDDPNADQIRVSSYKAVQGLSSDEVSCVTEDGLGRIYVGTRSGLDRLDPETGRIEHFTTADGLANDYVKVSFRDRSGMLWFGTDTGLSRLVPEFGHRQRTAPPIFITGLRIPGIDFHVSEIGETVVTGPEVSPSQNSIQIDFVSPAFDLGKTLRYQIKLEGANQDWSSPADQHMVNFANLAPGRYRFLVRAINAEGAVSEVPASVSFAILPPIWQRWWFIMIVLVLIASLISVVYRYRVARLLELERIRTRIAGDLHDHIGSNLTKIAILSEVAHQQLGLADKPAFSTLSSIADISRESVAAMRDIVWAINPKRDRLLDLTRRMRGFASEILTSRNIEFTFVAPERDRLLRMSPEVRRDVFLIFKEAINNIVRHSDCSKASIEMNVEGRWLVLSVTDDGKGFESEGESDGNGLPNMHRRADGFGGQLRIRSENGQGTTVHLKIPIDRWF